MYPDAQGRNKTNKFNNFVQGQEGSAQSLAPVSPDQVHLGLPGHQEHSGIESDAGAGQSAQMQKAKKCCCCVIM